MPVPTQEELEKRQKEARKRVENLRSTYEEFLKNWKDIESEEYKLLKQLHKHVDESELHSVLQKITNISD